MVENRSRRAPTPICVQRPRGPKSRDPATACPVAPSLSATLPQRAPARASTTPFIDGRKSVASRAASICLQRTRGPKSQGPVTACAVAPSLSATLADCAPARASPADPIHRWSKIGRVARPHQYACMQASGRPESQGPVTACPVAPSLSATLPQRAPARASTANPVSRWSKIGRVARPHQYACNDRGGRNREVRQTACPVAPSLSATPPYRARHPVHSRRRFSMLENLFLRPPTPICVQASV
jgi:hypothetical protein